LANLNESEMALFPECTAQCFSKELDTADIVRDGDLTSSKDAKPEGNILGRPFELSAVGSEKVHSAITVFYWLGGLGESGASMVLGGLEMTADRCLVLACQTVRSP
jgi:hypothetical protein